MNLYPAMKGRMGRWNYFIVKMTMKEVSENVKFSGEVHEARTLDEAIQREIGLSRVKAGLVEYLKNQKDRFFNSLVVAAIDGEPTWFPVTISDDPMLQVYKSSQMDDAFGVLRFDGNQNYYALDGQHRLAAIKELVDPGSEAYADRPDGFKSEEVSVIVVTPLPEEEDHDFLIRYRRLFGSLNRYAKPTKKITNIIMDEDDLYAILTRRLLVEHQFFKAVGGGTDSERVKTTAGEQTNSTAPHFTSLTTLYEMTISLLRGQPKTAQEKSELNTFRQVRPEEHVIEDSYKQLTEIWDALIEVLPDLEEDPPNMKCHDEDSDLADSALFWPITQKIIAELARDLMVEYDNDSLTDALSPLSQIEMSLHAAPWRHLVLIRAANGNWIHRNETRKDGTNMAHNILQWQLGLVSYDAQDMADMKEDWEQNLLCHFGQISEQEREELWEDIKNGHIA